MPFDRSPPSPANDYQAAHAELLITSYRTLLGKDLIDLGGAAIGRRLYHAPEVILAHEATSDPVFFYGNLAAQHLFAMDWSTLVHLPSRFSAEPLAREERQQLLDRVARHGFIDDYAGVRIARTGQRFRIEGATVWNLLGAQAQVVGQAAAFSRWQTLTA